jgi:hypothetical protein
LKRLKRKREREREKEISKRDKKNSKSLKQQEGDACREQQIEAKQ